MAVRVAINGFGRIGRLVLRAACEHKNTEIEVILTFALVLSIFLFVSSHRLMRWTPLMVWILVAVMVWLEAPISGTSLNPARSFGPALVCAGAGLRHGCFGAGAERTPARLEASRQPADHGGAGGEPVMAPPQDRA